MTEYTNDERDHMAGLVQHMTELAELHGRVADAWAAVSKRCAETGHAHNRMVADWNSRGNRIMAESCAHCVDALKDPSTYGEVRL